MRQALATLVLAIGSFVLGAMAPQTSTVTVTGDQPFHVPGPDGGRLYVDERGNLGTSFPVEMLYLPQFVAEAAKTVRDERCRKSLEDAPPGYAVICFQTDELWKATQGE